MNKNTLLQLICIFSLILFSFSKSHSQQYDFLEDVQRLKMLEPPKEKVDMVFDTDTYNEIDDQFALVYALLSDEKVNVKAVYAAPFLNSRSTSPADGMEKSYEEILRIFNLMGIEPDGFAFRGSVSFLKDGKNAENSEAANHLVNLASTYTKDKPLYVVAVGAPTNVSSAILKDPSITEKIVVVWLGGNSINWYHNREFNFRQDIHASRIIFDSGVPFVQIPCTPVTTHLCTTVLEMEANITSNSGLAKYLLKIFKDYFPDNTVARSKVLWDVSTIGWLVDDSWIPSNIQHSPVITDNYTYSFNPNRHLMRTAYFVRRDPIFRDLFTKISTRP